MCFNSILDRVSGPHHFTWIIISTNTIVPPSCQMSNAIWFSRIRRHFCKRFGYIKISLDYNTAIFSTLPCFQRLSINPIKSKLHTYTTWTYNCATMDMTKTNKPASYKNENDQENKINQEKQYVDEQHGDGWWRGNKDHHQSDEDSQQNDREWPGLDQKSNVTGTSTLSVSSEYAYQVMNHMLNLSWFEVFETEYINEGFKFGHLNAWKRFRGSSTQLCPMLSVFSQYFQTRETSLRAIYRVKRLTHKRPHVIWFGDKNVLQMLRALIAVVTYSLRKIHVTQAFRVTFAGNLCPISVLKEGSCIHVA